MKRIHALVLAAGLTLAGMAAGLAVVPAPAAPGPPAGKEARNLVPNGDFEEGKGTPTGWQAVDGLTTFWVKDPDPRHGKVIKFDTDVYQKQGYEIAAAAWESWAAEQSARRWRRSAAPSAWRSCSRPRRAVRTGSTTCRSSR